MTTTGIPDELTSPKTHRYPWWLAFLLTSPIRKWLETPEAILGDLVEPGQTVLELGPANGYFSVPIAEALGADGQLVAIDIQPQMLRMLERRLRARGLERRLVARQCRHIEDELGDLAGRVDLVVAINVIHEVAKPRETIFALAGTLRPGGRLLLVEPRGHVSAERFDAELGWAREAGLEPAAQNGGAPANRFRTCLQRPATIRS